MGGPLLYVSRLCPILARGSIHRVYHGAHCVYVCVCLFDISCSPLPPLRLPNSHLISGGVKIASDPCPRVNPFCVSQGSVCVCVCVCVFDITSSPHSVLPMFIAQCFNQWGATPTCVKIGSYPSRGFIHRVYHGGHCVCVCVFVRHNLFPPPPTASSQCS